MGSGAKFWGMENSTTQSLLAGVIGINTIATFTLAYLIGCYKGGLDTWRKKVDEEQQAMKTEISAIHKQDVRNVTVDTQLTRQTELIKLLGKRTHDLRNVLAGLALIPKTADMSGFEEPVSGGD